MVVNIPYMEHMGYVIAYSIGNWYCGNYGITEKNGSPAMKILHV